MLSSIMQLLTTPIQKQCPVCSIGFETKTPDKVYCSVTCRNRAHRKKEQQSNVKAPAPTEAQVEAMMYFMPPITNPTEEVVLQTANLLLAVKSLKPVLFRGTVPMVAMPSERLHFGQTLEPTEWLLFYE